MPCHHICIDRIIWGEVEALVILRRGWGGGGVTADRQGGGVLNMGSYQNGSCGRSTSYQLYMFLPERNSHLAKLKD